jgi:hypothetical protein
MSDNESEPDTQAGMTENLPTIQAPEQVQAWSDDDNEPETERQSWRSAWGIVAVILACCAVLGGAVSMALWVSKPDESPPVATSAARPAPTLSTSATNDDDAKLLALVRNSGWQAVPRQGWPLGSADEPAVIEDARAVCTAVQLHFSAEDTASRLRRVWPGISQGQVSWFMVTAVNVYCPQLSIAVATQSAPPAAPPPPVVVTVTPPPQAPAPQTTEPCYYSPEHLNCPPRGLSPDERANW